MTVLTISVEDVKPVDQIQVVSRYLYSCRLYVNMYTSSNCFFLLCYRTFPESEDFFKPLALVLDASQCIFKPIDRGECADQG